VPIERGVVYISQNNLRLRTTLDKYGIWTLVNRSVGTDKSNDLDHFAK